MLTKLKNHITYANVVASIALFAVLGGGMAVAAGLKKNSVKSKQIAANAVKEAELAAGAVTTDKLADNAATGAKVDESTLGQVPSAASADSAQTANSAQTAQNAANAQNATNAANAQNAVNAQNAATADLADVATFAEDTDSVNGLVVDKLRPDGASGADSDDIDLDGTADIVVQTPDFNVPNGGADIMAVASLNLRNDAATASEAFCQLRSDNGGTSMESTGYLVNTPAVNNYDANMTMVGFDTSNNVAGPNNVRVICTGTGDIDFVEGNIGVTVFPTD